jgi:tetratricopeptide (TPR) repeat protein
MDLFTSLLIAGIVLVSLMVFIPSLVMSIVGQLLLSRPDDYEGWCYYGTLLERRGHHLQAYNAYLKSIEINPNYSEAHGRLDNLLLKMQNEGEPTDSFRQPDLDSI